MEKKSKYDPGLRVIFYVACVSSVAIILISTSGGWKYFFANLALSLSISIASGLCGGFIGFLFGIPKSLQRNHETVEDVNNTPKRETSKRERLYGNNTNLEQISDWLTKIIVGVSLTQIPQISKSFDSLVGSISSSIQHGLLSGFAYPYVGSIIVLFALCGFLAGYIYGKIHLLKQLVNLEDSLYKELLYEQDTRINAIEKRQLQNFVTEYNRAKERVEAAEQVEEIIPLINAANPNAIKYFDDCQKGRWGGKSENERYYATAKVLKHSGTQEEKYSVNIILRAKPGNSLTGKSYFFLHDSYSPQMILSKEAENDQVSIEINSFEAFTVGIVFDNGNEKLELDLNKVPDVPNNYKYSGDLLTIDEINESLKEANN